MSKVFYPTNLGGMSINWVDYLGSAENSTNKSELLIDHIATMSNENNGKDVYINFFEKLIVQMMRLHRINIRHFCELILQKLLSMILSGQK